MLTEMALSCAPELLLIATIQGGGGEVMTKKLKKPIAFLTVFAMLLSVLLYFPEGTFGGFGLGVRASAADDSNKVYYDVGEEVSADNTHCVDSNTYTPEEPPKDGSWYRISTPGHLYWFAQQVNGGNPGINATLENDIILNTNVLNADGTLNTAEADTFAEWKPMGTADEPFTGLFYGNGYHISGLYFNDDTVEYGGLFGVIGEDTDGRIYNVGIVDSYFNGGDYVGAIAGQNNFEIVACFSTAVVVSASGTIGGLCADNNYTLTRSYYLDRGFVNAVDSAKALGADSFKNGELAYKLCVNSGYPRWGQLLIGENADSLPVPRTEKNAVYFSQNKYHNHSGDFCKLCNVFVPNKPDQDENGTYLITKASELVWFGNLMYEGHSFSENKNNAKLMNDITMNSDVLDENGNLNTGTFISWTPIGYEELWIFYTGTFDGNGYTISGLYVDDNTATNVGLFGCIANGTITKLRIVDSYFNGKENVGAICGNIFNGGTISECYVEANVAGVKYAGGICGKNSNGEIKDCFHEGIVNSESCGGIVGYNNGGSVKNCINVGDVKGTDCDNICGETTSYDAIQDCYFNKDLTTQSLYNDQICTQLTTYELTSDSFLPGSSTAWEKPQNDNTDHILYYPRLKNIRADGLAVEYTPSFDLVWTDTTTPVYGDDLHFTLDTVIEIYGKKILMNTEIVSAVIRDDQALLPLVIEITNNDKVIREECTLKPNLSSTGSKLIIMMGEKEFGYIDISSTPEHLSMVITGDIDVGESTFKMTYTGTAIPWFTGATGSQLLTIEKATPTVTDPTASAIDYGKKLSESVLDLDGWNWEAGDIIPHVDNNGYVAVIGVDDKNYDYTNITGYDSTTHIVKRTISLTVNRAAPTIVVKPEPSAVLPGKTVKVSAVITNPNNNSMTDLPSVSFSYKIGSGAETPITGGSFVVPEDTAKGTIITVIANTPETADYNTATKSAKVTVTDCKHANKVLKFDENSHWYHCNNCDADIDYEEHKGGTATCIDKAVCTVCKQEYGSIDSDNHAKKSNVWSNDATGHWHGCEACHAQLDKAEHISSGPATEDNAELCTICDYVITRASGCVATPVISPNGGTFSGSRTVSITCDTSGAVIYYTTNGDDPTANSKKYTEPFTISSSLTVKAIALKLGVDDSLIAQAVFTKSSSGGPSGPSGPSRPSRPSTPTKPSIGGSEKSWEEIAAELAKLPIGSEVTMELNSNTTVPVEVIKVIADRKLKVTFVYDSVRSWKTDGAEITAPAEADLSILTTNKLKTDELRGISGIQFTISNTGIPTDLAISFKADFASQFANLYKSVDGKLVFVTCAKLGADGKVILPDVIEKGDYVAMLCEFSDLSGDMNNDGILNALDASAVLKDIVGLEPGKNPIMADFSGDGLMNAMDASAILKRIVGIA